MGNDDRYAILKKWSGGIITLIIFLYIFSVVRAEIAPAMDDLRLALTIIMFVWILNWMRSLLGSARLAVLFALVISYLVFFKHPNLLFTVFGLMILIYFIKPFYKKATETNPPPHVEIMNFYKDLAEKSKGGIWLTSPTAWPFYYPPMVAIVPTQQQQQQQNQGGVNR